MTYYMEYNSEALPWRFFPEALKTSYNYHRTLTFSTFLYPTPTPCQMSHSFQNILIIFFIYYYIFLLGSFSVLGFV